MKTDKRPGRPPKITPDILAKLDHAFSIGMTDKQASLYSGISIHTLYRYIEKHPEYRERKETLKETPILKAKINVVSAIENNDLETSKWYLERRARDEFSKTDNVAIVSDSMTESINDMAASIKAYLSTE